MVSSLTSSLVKISAMEDLAPVKTQNSKENTSDFFFFVPGSAFVAIFFQALHLSPCALFTWPAFWSLPGK